MVREDYHVHTSFSDGKSSVQEVVDSALKMGMTSMGFSDHGYAPVDIDCCIPKEQLAAYRAQVRAAAKKYEGILPIALGIEQDYFGTEPTDEYEYVIGSVHYVKIGNDYYAVDYLIESLIQAARYHYQGDMYSVAECYFDHVAQVVDKTKCDIIGHFDLVSKLNERYYLFDVQKERYVKAWQRAADELLKTGRPFEVNTGAISRGYKQEPYPSCEMIQYIAQRGGKFILSSDSHHKDTLCYQFDRWEEELKRIGAERVSFSVSRK